MTAYLLLVSVGKQLPRLSARTLGLIQSGVLAGRGVNRCRRQPDGGGHGSGGARVDVLPGHAGTSRAVCPGQRRDARLRDRRVVDSVWGGKLSILHLDLL